MSNLGLRYDLVGNSIRVVVLIGLFGLSASCSMLRFGKGGASKAPEQPRLVDQQIQIQRLVDDCFARGGQGLDQSAERLGTDLGRKEVLRIKLVLGSSLLSVASGPNPNANLLDLVSLIVLTRMSIRDYWMKTTNGAAFQPWLDANQVLETNAWVLAGRFLRPDQVNELRKGIEQWYARTPEVRTAFFARPEAFASMVRTSQEEGATKNSVFSLITLDPFTGLDPAVREVTQTRLFAERGMYTAQRLPFMLRLQAELLAYEFAEQPAARQSLTNLAQFNESAQRIGRAAESLSQSVAQLPNRVSAERKEILATLELQEGKFRDLAATVDGALLSGEKMSGSLNIAVTNFDALMKRFGVGEPRVEAASRTNGRPFDILDYARTADEIASMAKNLNTLLDSVNQSAPQLQRLSRQADADVEKVVDHGFRLGLVLIAALLSGSVLAGLLYTFLAQKLRQHRPLA